MWTISQWAAPGLLRQPVRSGRWHQAYRLIPGNRVESRERRGEGRHAERHVVGATQGADSFRKVFRLKVAPPAIVIALAFAMRLAAPNVKMPTLRARRVFDSCE
jgi:hypothetical protein